MKSRTWMFGVFSLLVVLFVATSTVYAAPIRVDCGRGGSISATLASLASAGNTRGITIFVTGTCKENIVIVAFDHLVLQGLPIATLQDASNGNATVVKIAGSYYVTLQGFTINGGNPGVNCGAASVCVLNLNTIQQSVATGVRVGHSTAFFTGNNILNNATDGISVLASHVYTESNTISNNGTVAIAVSQGGNLTAYVDQIQGNTVGIRAVNSSVVEAGGSTISNNKSDGVLLESGSTAVFEGDNVVTGNGGNGVDINDLSFANFNGDNVSGNLTQPDVACFPQYSATRGAGTVGGTTNCVEPLHKK